MRKHSVNHFRTVVLVASVASCAFPITNSFENTWLETDLPSSSISAGELVISRVHKVVKFLLNVPRVGNTATLGRHGSLHLTMRTGNKNELVNQ